MNESELDAWIEQERQKDQKRWDTATCFVCGRAYQWPDVLLELTNDWQRFVCHDHQNQDHSSREFDVGQYLSLDLWFKDRKDLWPEILAQLQQRKYYRLVNIPLLLQAKETPAQPTLW